MALPPHLDLPAASPFRPAAGSLSEPETGAHMGPVRAWYARLPLSTRLVSLVMIVLMVGLGTAAILTTTLLRSYLIAQVDRDLSTTYSSIATQLINDQSQTSNLLPSDYYLAYRQLNGLVTPWIQKETAQERGIPDLSIYLSGPLHQVAQPPDTPFTVKAVVTDTQWRVIAREVANLDGQRVGEVFVALPLTHSLAVIDQIQRVLFLSALFITVCAGAVGTFAVRQSLRPLAAIERTAAAIAQGDLTRRVPSAPVTTEVGSLARSLNTMLAQIEQAFADREASEVRMRQFVSDASHELRTPLATIRGYGELYRMGALRAPDEMDDTMRRIEDSATRMGALVEDLLHLARLDEGRKLRIEPVDVKILAVDAASDLNALDPTRRIKVVGLTTDHPQQQPVLALGDEDRLHQVMSNLIGNIARHTPSGTPVEIAIGTAADPATGAPRVVLEVRDHGEGISPEHRDKIFERFYRIDSSRNRASGGSGLGLAIVAAILAAHGGTARMSDTAGGGLTVRLELPAAP